LPKITKTTKTKFDAIRPFYDAEIESILNDSSSDDEVINELYLSEMSDEEWKERLAKTHSIRDFQCNFIYHTLLKVLEKF
jgi:hypothetical protein